MKDIITKLAADPIDTEGGEVRPFSGNNADTDLTTIIINIINPFYSHIYK